jgi:hypothetical protein
MPADYLHNHRQFPELIRIVAEQRVIDPALVEKDYWIMHTLYGFAKAGAGLGIKGRHLALKGLQDHRSVF